MPRKEKKFHFIYKTTNTITGRYYYGMHSTNNLEDGYLGSGKRLRYSINKYGESVHSREILEFCDTREELAKREKEIVNLNEIAKDKCMNLGIGGNGGYINPEQARKGGLATANKNKLNGLFNNPEYLKKRSNILKEKWKNEEYRKNILSKINWTGRRHSEETKDKLKNTFKRIGHQSGTKNSNYGKCWITNEINSKKINKNDNIPEGWKLGRKLK